MTGRPCPVDAGSSALAADFWETVAEARALHVQGCPKCSQAQFPPRLRCANCGSAVLEWWTAPSFGELVAVVVGAGEEARHRPARRFRALTPYATGLIRTEPWPLVRLPVVLLGPDVQGPDAHALGKVSVEIEDLGGVPTPIASRSPSP